MPRDLFRIEPHDSIDKSFLIEGPLPLEVDYDDVPRDAVDLLAERLVTILNRYWVPPKAYFCYNKDCSRAYETQTTSVGPNNGCPECWGRMELEDVKL